MEIYVPFFIMLYIAVFMIVAGINGHEPAMVILSKTVFWPLWLIFYIVYAFFYTFKLMYEKLKN